MPAWFMLNKSIKNGFKKGFTVIEVMVALFIIVTGIVGISGLLSQTVASSSLVSSKLIAGYLAQEGIEIVRNIRDSNWLEQRSEPAIFWDQGIPVGNWEADYQSISLSSPFAGSGSYLKIGNSNGLYSYSAGQTTKFKRKITINKDTDVIMITVTVFWDEKRKNQSFVVKENLYNWNK
jgi:prepilin-type N-terminal cleavage/methylation domain-containing protein